MVLPPFSQMPLIFVLCRSDGFKIKGYNFIDLINNRVRDDFRAVYVDSKLHNQSSDTFNKHVGCAYIGTCTAIKDKPEESDAYDPPCGLWKKRGKTE